MKKVLMSFLMVCSLGLAACTSNDSEEANVSAQSTEQTTTERSKEPPEATFEEGVFENDEFKITYKEAKIIKSPMERKHGLYTTFELENKSDEKINPRDVLESYVIMSQENDTSEVEMNNRYYSADAFGPESDTESYNEQVDIDNKLQDDLKPEKQDEYVISYELDNKEYPVNMETLIDSEFEEYSESYEINLDNLEEVPEPGTEGAVEETDVEDDQDITENDEMDTEKEAMENETVTPEISDEEAEANLAERDRFVEEFTSENGRKPSSGEIQAHWLEQE